MRIGWIGVGNLGSPIVRRLIDAGHALTLYDQRPLTGFDAVIAEKLEEAASCEAVFSTLPSDAIFESVGREALSALPTGSIYCDMSTVSPQASARVAASAGGKAFLRAPVSGSVSHAQQGILTVIASGPADAFARLVPVFEAFSVARHYVGEAEEARVLKLMVNDLVGATAALMGETLAMGRKAGLDHRTMLDVLDSSAIASPLVKYKVGPLAERDFAPAFTTELMIKDMSLVTETAAQMGCKMPLAQATLAVLRAHADAGGGEEDFFAVLKTFERQAGL